MAPMAPLLLLLIYFVSSSDGANTCGGVLCASVAMCVNTNGNSACQCPPVYTGNGVTCAKQNLTIISISPTTGSWLGSTSISVTLSYISTLPVGTSLACNFATIPAASVNVVKSDGTLTQITVVSPPFSDNGLYNVSLAASGSSVVFLQFGFQVTGATDGGSDFGSSSDYPITLPGGAPAPTFTISSSSSSVMLLTIDPLLAVELVNVTYGNDIDVWIGTTKFSRGVTIVNVPYRKYPTIKVTIQPPTEVITSCLGVVFPLTFTRPTMNISTSEPLSVLIMQPWANFSSFQAPADGFEILVDLYFAPLVFRIKFGELEAKVNGIVMDERTKNSHVLIRLQVPASTKEFVAVNIIGSNGATAMLYPAFQYVSSVLDLASMSSGTTNSTVFISNKPSGKVVAVIVLAIVVVIGAAVGGGVLWGRKKKTERELAALMARHDAANNNGQIQSPTSATSAGGATPMF